MATQAQIDAFMKAVTPLVDKKIKEEEVALVPVFMQHSVDEKIVAHRQEINAFLRQIAGVGMDAAGKVT